MMPTKTFFVIFAVFLGLWAPSAHSKESSHSMPFLPRPKPLPAKMESLVKHWLDTQRFTDFADKPLRSKNLVGPIVAHRFGTKCKGREIFVVPLGELKYRIEASSEPYSPIGGLSGSGGAQILLFAYDKEKGTLKRLIKQNAIVFGPPLKAHTDCPSFGAVLHGTTFGLFGAEYRFSTFDYDAGEDKYLPNRNGTTKVPEWYK